MESGAIVPAASQVTPLIEEVEDESALSARPSEEEVMATFNAHLDRMVNHFWQQTQQLADQHALLQSNQHRQAQRQDQALQAVYNEAHNSVNHLADQQRFVVGQLETALAQCRETMEQRIIAAVSEQNELNQASHATMREQLRLVLAEAQQEIIATRQRVALQEEQTAQVEARMREALVAVQNDVVVRLEDLAGRTASSQADTVAQLNESRREIIEESVAQAEMRINSTTGGKMTARRTKALIERSVSDMEVRVESKLQRALQNTIQEETHALIEDEMTAAEQRVEARLRQSLKDMHTSLETEIDKHEESISSIGAGVEAVTHRVHELQERLTLLEATHGPSEGSDLEQRVALAIKRLLGDTLGHQARATRTRRQTKARVPTRDIASVVRKAQKDVQQRAERVARYYEMRILACPRDPDVEIEEE